MNYYISNIVRNTSFSEVEARVSNLLKEQGFGVITEIDVKTIFKNKLGVDFRPYKILGACHPAFAHEALQSDDKIGVMLPCNVCIQQKNETDIEVFAVNPLVVMKPLGVDGIEEFAMEIYKRLNQVIESL